MYYESFQTKEEAMRREWEIKQLKRGEKEKLIGNLADNFMGTGCAAH